MSAYATALEEAERDLAALNIREQDLVGELVAVEAERSDINALIERLKSRLGNGIALVAPAEVATADEARESGAGGEAGRVLLDQPSQDGRKKAGEGAVVANSPPVMKAPQDGAPPAAATPTTDLRVRMAEMAGLGHTAPEIATALNCTEQAVYAAARETPFKLKTPTTRTPHNVRMRTQDAPKHDPNAPPTEQMDRLWRAITAICDEGKEPLWGEMCTRADVKKGSLGYLLDALETRGFIKGYRRGGPGGMQAVKRPADMPVPAPRAPKPQRPTVFTRTVKVERPAPTPETVTKRDVVRFLAKDVGLVVIGPDDEDHYTIEKEAGVDDDRLVIIANAHRLRLGKGPFVLGEASA